jgi:hypothetical protein
MEILSTIEVERKKKEKTEIIITHAIVKDGIKIRKVRIASNWTLAKLWYSGILEKNK